VRLAGLLLSWLRAWYNLFWVIGVGVLIVVLAWLGENSALDGDAELRIEASVTIDRPLDRVWRFMTDFSNYPKIRPTFVEMKQTSSGSVGVGTTFDAMHQKAVYHLRIREY
jgi:hypothetical protein